MEKLGEITRKAGISCAWIDAGIAITQAIEKPTLGNVTKAGVKIALAGLESYGKVNPGVGIFVTILDISGVTDAIFNW